MRRWRSYNHCTTHFISVIANSIKMIWLLCLYRISGKLKWLSKKYHNTNMYLQEYNWKITYITTLSLLLITLNPVFFLSNCTLYSMLGKLCSTNGTSGYGGSNRLWSGSTIWNTKLEYSTCYICFIFLCSYKSLLKQTSQDDDHWLGHNSRKAAFIQK
jgi:hypothetical protein